MRCNERNRTSGRHVFEWNILAGVACGLMPTADMDFPGKPNDAGKHSDEKASLPATNGGIAVR